MKKCALCREERELRRSHIVPAFVFAYIKETSATGYLRRTTTPNRREQDGARLELLCASCEGVLGDLESWFSSAVFRPFQSDPAGTYHYDARLLRFGASLTWRALEYYAAKDVLSQVEDHHHAALQRARETWRRVVRQELPHPGEHEVHLVPFDIVASTTNPALQPNFNRYVTRAVDIDIPSGQSSAFVYVKLPRLAFVGVIVEPPGARRWKNTRINANGGAVFPRQFVLPTAFGDYVNDQAAKAADAIRAISPRQQAQIEATLTADIPKLARSESFAAMKADVALFGRSAFLREYPDEAAE